MNYTIQRCPLTHCASWNQVFGLGCWKIPGNNPESVNHKWNNLSCSFADFYDLSCRVLYFRLLRLDVFIPTSIKTHLWLLSCIRLIWGRLLSKCLSVKMVVLLMGFTCAFSSSDSGEYSYHFSAHSRPCVLHSSQASLLASANCHGVVCTLFLCQLKHMPCFQNDN